MEEYEHEQLDKMLQIFYTEIRTKDGCEYEPESLKSMLAALDRYLKEHDYKYSIIRDREFHQSKLVLEGKVKCLRQQGKGKRPNAANALTAEEEKMLWSEQSLGDCSPRVLSQTMWWILTQHFGLRGRQEHHSMEVEDFSFCVDDSGTEYVTFKENPTKTRQGGLNTKHRSVLPKMFATGGQRCPVELLKQYLSRRPQELRDKGPFYLAIIENPKTNVWYKMLSLIKMFLHCKPYKRCLRPINQVGLLKASVDIYTYSNKKFHFFSLFILFCYYLQHFTPRSHLLLVTMVIFWSA